MLTRKEDAIPYGRASIIQNFSTAQVSYSLRLRCGLTFHPSHLLADLYSPKGQYSERIEALPDQQVQSEVMGVLHSMFPKTDIPSPSDFFFPRWHSDPLYRGSYSNWPASFTREHHDNLRASIGCGGRKRLWFAGEATSLGYFGTLSFLILPVIYSTKVGFLHGAYMEGLSVTQEMIACIRHGKCAGQRSL